VFLFVEVLGGMVEDILPNTALELSNLQSRGLRVLVVVENKHHAELEF
jgi:hypothetical protein